MIDKSRDLEYPALGYVYSVAAVNSTGSYEKDKSKGITSASSDSNGPDANFQSVSGIKATRNFAFKAKAACAVCERGFLIAWASSRTTTFHSSC